MLAAIATPSPAQGRAKPPRRSAASPKIGGQIVTPNEEIASPRPMAVPAPRGPTSSAISVCWTPFQPMPKKPKQRVSGASTPSSPRPR